MRNSRNVLLSVLVTVMACCSMTANADDERDGEHEQDVDSHDDTSQGDHSHEVEEVHVVAHPLSDGGLATTWSVVDRDQIEKSVQTSIGRVVSHTAGIHMTSFGESVGRPVIHGLSGTRVIVLEDESPTMDASTLGADHVVTTEAVVAESIDVLKGSSTLLYGTGAIGGVVDVHTHRIPPLLVDELQGKGEFRWADNGDRKSGAIVLEGSFERVAWHFDLFARDSGVYSIPVPPESERLHMMEEHHEDDEDEHHEEDEHHDEDEHEEQEAEFDGTLPSSQFSTQGGAFGFSFVEDWGFVGICVSQLGSEYGLPGHSHGHEDEEEHHDEDEEEHHDEDEDEHHDEDEHEDEHHGDEEGGAVLDASQTRISVEGRVNGVAGSASDASFRLTVNDYEHFEIEGDGVHSTRFGIKSFDGRGQISPSVADSLTRAIGVHVTGRDYSVIGEEAFVPPVDTSTQGVFWLGERSFESFDLELGARVDRVSHQPMSGSETDFNNFAASMGFVIPKRVAGDWEFGIQGDYSTRAPAAEELYSDGPHLATGRVEVGDPNLENEVALGLSATARHAASWGSVTATGYLSRLGDFIVLLATGREEHELPVVEYVQADATLRGIDLEATLNVVNTVSTAADLKFRFDTIAASVDIPEDTIPQLPPTRFGIGLDVEWNAFDFSIELTRVGAQDEVTRLEIPTDSYNDLNIFASRDLTLNMGELRVFLVGTNLTDEEQRNHLSSIKDIVPQPGRNIEVGLRMRL